MLCSGREIIQILELEGEKGRQQPVGGTYMLLVIY